MTDTYDKKSRLKIANEDLEQAKFKKTLDEKIAVRVGNSDKDPLYVTAIDGPVENDLYIYDEADPVVKEVLTEIVRYLVPVGKFINLDQITVSGDNIAKYIVSIGGVTNKVKRTYYGSSLNEEFKYNSYRVDAGNVIKVEVIHFNNAQGSFEGTIEGRLNNV